MQVKFSKFETMLLSGLFSLAVFGIVQNKFVLVDAVAIQAAKAGTANADGEPQQGHGFDRDELSAMSVAALKAACLALELDASRCVEKTELVDLIMECSSLSAIRSHASGGLHEAATAAAQYSYDNVVILRATQEWLKRFGAVSMVAGSELKTCLDLMNVLLAGSETDPMWDTIISHAVAMFAGVEAMKDEVALRSVWGNGHDGVNIQKLRTCMATRISQMMGCRVDQFMFERAINIMRSNDSNIECFE